MNAHQIKEGIAQFTEEKRALEERLRVMIAGELDAFAERTGATADQVDVCIVTVPRLGMSPYRYTSAVRVSTPLD